MILAHKFLFLVYALLKWFKDFFVSLVESVTCFKLLNWLTYCMNTWVCRISMIVVFALVEWCDCIWIWKWSVLLLHTCIVLENVKKGFCVHNCIGDLYEVTSSIRFVMKVCKLYVGVKISFVFFFFIGLIIYLKSCSFIVLIGDLIMWILVIDTRLVKQ